MEINEEVSAQLKLLKLKPDGSDLTHLSADSLASLNSTWEAFSIAKFLPQPSKSHAALVSAVRRAFGIQSKHGFDLLRHNSERFILKFRHMVDRQRAFHRQQSVVYESYSSSMIGMVNRKWRMLSSTDSIAGCKCMGR